MHYPKWSSYLMLFAKIIDELKHELVQCIQKNVLKYDLKYTIRQGLQIKKYRVKVT